MNVLFPIRTEAFLQTARGTENTGWTRHPKPQQQDIGIGVEHLGLSLVQGLEVFEFSGHAGIRWLWSSSGAG